MSRLLRSLGIAVLLLAAAAPARAWGPEGHAIAADIAEAHLTREATVAVTRLLATEGHTHLDEIASWADADSAEHHETQPWHYVDIPLAASGYDAARDCPAGACVIVKLEEFSRILADRAASGAARLEALKWVVHLAGDIHQPLHDADDGDKGGNTVLLTWYGTPTNLHAVWDLGIIEHALGVQLGPDYSFDHAASRAAAIRLDRSISLADRRAWTRGIEGKDPAAADIGWSNEGHRLAQDIVYRDLPADRSGDWCPAYQAAAWPVVGRQLERAGIRLAALLNRVL